MSWWLSAFIFLHLTRFIVEIIFEGWALGGLNNEREQANGKDKEAKFEQSSADKFFKKMLINSSMNYKENLRDTVGTLR